MGKGFGCNPKYAAQELIRRGDSEKYDLVWIVSRKDMVNGGLPPQIRAVRHGSLKSLFEYATASEVYTIFGMDSKTYYV